jgi:hypothetical protein
VEPPEKAVLAEISETGAGHVGVGAVRQRADYGPVSSATFRNEAQQASDAADTLPAMIGPAKHAHANTTAWKTR